MTNILEDFNKNIFKTCFWETSCDT